MTRHLRSLRKARSSFATSSKCSPVVGSSNRKSLPWKSRVTPEVSRPQSRPNGSPPPRDGRRASAAAPRPRTASAPAVRASRTRGQRLRAAAGAQPTSRTSAKNASASRDRHVEDIGDARATPTRKPSRLDLEDLVAVAPTVAIRAAQVHVGEELHLDVLEAVAPAGRAATGAGVEAEGAGRCTCARARRAPRRTARG
jgi:hypothetical protein